MAANPNVVDTTKPEAELRMIAKTYLGDAVYAEWNECGQLKLTTWNGLRDTNTIYLEPEVIAVLQAYLEASKKREPRKRLPLNIK